MLPAMIRKIYLAKCLNEGDWNAVRNDINFRPVEGINGDNCDEDILVRLAKFGITPDAVTFGGVVLLCVNFFGVRKWRMPVYMCF